jgi:outer membrane protein OmpA-like peptidoglycan-associated protein
MRTVTSGFKAGAVGLALAGCAAAAYAGTTAGTADGRGEGSKQADIGVVTGLTVGAFAAGPLGAIVGATAGALIGDGFHRQAKSRAALAQQLDQSETQRAHLTKDVAQLESSLTEAHSRTAQLDQTVQNTDEVGLDVSFRTDDDSVTAQALPPLLKLGALAASLPQAQLRIAGYADPRGSDAYNDELSRRRAESVAAVLMSAGMPGERMLIEAHGKTEAVSADGDLDAYALERRVTVRLQLPDSGQVARRD